MTATRDRESDLEQPASVNRWGTRAAFGSRPGLPWWGAVLLALGLTAIGVAIDMLVSKKLGTIFEVLYFAGCVIAVLWVQRRSVFGPMVQSPLILAVTIPAVVLATNGAPQSSMAAKALAVGTPLINGFPAMAVTTGITVLIGLARVFTQRKPAADAEPRPPRSAAGRSGGDRPAQRQGGPRRSSAGAAGAPGADRPNGGARGGGDGAARQQGGSPQARQRPQAPGQQPRDAQGRRQPARPAGGDPGRRPANPGRPPQRRPEPPRHGGFGYDDDLYTD